MLIVSTPHLSRASRRMLAVTRLVRPANLAILFVAVLLGGLLGAGPAGFGPNLIHRLLLAGLSAVLVAAAGNAVNDVHDFEIDRINRPDRPLPSGAVHAAVAWRIWGAASALGVLIGLAVSFTHALLAASCVALLYGYSAAFKRTPLLGNVVIALVTGLSLIYGALLGQLLTPVVAGFGFAFTTTLAREIVKDVQDSDGDRLAGASTLPIRFGTSVAVMAAISLLLVTVLATPLPFLYLNYGGIYLLGILVTDAVLLRVVWILVEGSDNYPARASHLTKWAMVSGILALGLFWVR